MANKWEIAYKPFTSLDKPEQEIAQYARVIRILQIVPHLHLHPSYQAEFRILWGEGNGNPILAEGIVQEQDIPRPNTALLDRLYFYNNSVRRGVDYYRKRVQLDMKTHKAKLELAKTIRQEEFDAEDRRRD